jgi:hypothetical protein
MKTKVILLLLSVLVALFTVNNAFAGGAIAFGIDFLGDHEVSSSGISVSEDVDTGISLFAELYGTIDDNFDIGGGATWQYPRSLEDFHGDFYFISYYGMVRSRFKSEKVTPYITGQLGYNWFRGDSDYKGPFGGNLDGGFYYGLGGGIIINKHFQIGLLYSVNNGTADILGTGTDFDIEYSKLTLLFGYNF